MTATGTTAALPIAALIVAAGKGERAGGGIPKQYAMLAGTPVVTHAVDRLSAMAAIDRVQVVIGEGQERLCAAALAGRALPPPVTGGATRRESVLAGLDALAGAGISRVLIHDAARPLVTEAVVTRLLAALDSHDGAVPVLAVADTLARTDDGGETSLLLGDTVARAGLLRVQTPQAFRFDAVMAAHRTWKADQEATDDAQMVRANGGTVALVAGDPMLDKLTFQEDFAMAEARLAGAVSFRTATGFDVHRLSAGEELWLGGVRIAHDKGLAGHSDADVALHALTDALLGTIGAADIGAHFPPADPQWRGARSDRFLAHAASLIAAQGGAIEHVDLTIICEAPKIAPHREAMRQRIGEILGLDPGRVSVKATTTEGLGYAGRGEGIAAQAAATVRMSR